MERRGIAQEYYILTVTDIGCMPAMHREEGNAALVAAGFMDLLMNEVVSMDGKTIKVERELPDSLEHLTVLYEYLKKKPRTALKMISDFLTYDISRMGQFIAETGASLLGDQSVREEKGGMLGNRTVYIPQKSARTALAERLREAARDGGDMSPEDGALLWILKSSKNLDQYFSKFERKDLKARLKELKKDPQSLEMGRMIRYMSSVDDMLLACLMVGIIV